MNSNRGAEWVARMRSGSLSRRERADMQQWMTESAENSRDLLRAEATWRLAGALENDALVREELQELDRPELDPGLRRGDEAWGWKIAAVVVIGLSVAVWLAAAPPSYETTRGEQRVVTLADGSSIALNTDTQLKVRLSDSSREVFLQRGEALFQVVRDSQRPFTVHAGEGYVRAVGTRFNVLKQDNGVTVSVLEGRVAVSPTATAGAPKLLDAGQSIAYSGKKLSAAEPAKASTERIVAWREGKLRFESWRLDRAIREYNRYAEKPIRLESPQAASVEISGVFRIGDSQSFVQALGELVRAQVVDEGDALLLKPAATN